MVTRWAHNPKIGGSIPSLATNKKIFVKVFGNMKIFSDLYKVLRLKPTTNKTDCVEPDR